MRWRLLRRRLSIAAPRMSVRSHLPWPLRWAAIAVMLGFSGALGLWAFEFGKGIAGLDQEAREAVKTLAEMRIQLQETRGDRDRAQSLANAADSLLKTEQATQQRLAEQVKALEMENLALKDDLGFFERLLPATGQGLAIRGLQADAPTPGQLRFQLLIMQQGGRSQPEFKGSYEVRVSGTLSDKAWAMTTPLASKTLEVRQYQRVEGVGAYPVEAVIKRVQVRVLDLQGRVLATQILKI